jgi:adenosylhomocysteine nucleosidase
VSPDRLQTYPYGEFFRQEISGNDCIFFHSRRTKTRAAGACQYAIDRWQIEPLLVVGTCGGVGAGLAVGDVIAATRTIQYDCHDRRPEMGHTVVADSTWLDLTGISVHQGPIASADRDMTFDVLTDLRSQGVLGADWESGAIATVCSLNKVRWAVLRAITDVPLEPGDRDVSRQVDDYNANAPRIMMSLLDSLPRILAGISAVSGNVSSRV